MIGWMHNVVWGNREAPAVYDDWTIDPATRIITHGPTGYRFEVFRPSADPESFCARLVIGRPRMPESFSTCRRI